MKILKETSKSSEMIHTKIPKNENLNPDNNPTLNRPFVSKLTAELSPVFSNPLVNKQQNMKVVNENCAKKDKENIFKEKETLQKNFSYLNERQKIYNDKMVQCLSINNIFSSEILIFDHDLELLDRTIYSAETYDTMKMENQEKMKLENQEKMKLENQEKMKLENKREINSEDSLTNAINEQIKRKTSSASAKLVNVSPTRRQVHPRWTYIRRGRLDEKKYYYDLKLKINKFIYILSKYRQEINYNSILIDPSLFFPKRILETQPNVKYQFFVKYVRKTAILTKVVPKLKMNSMNLKTNPNEELKEHALGLKSNQAGGIDKGQGFTLRDSEKGREGESMRGTQSFSVSSTPTPTPTPTPVGALIIITNLIKQGLKYDKDLSFLIKKKIRDINNLISYKNILNIEPALLEKISSFTRYRLLFLIEIKKLSSLYQKELELHDNKMIVLNKEKEKEKDIKFGKILNKIFIPINPINPGSDPSCRSAGYNVSQNLEFEAPKLTNLPFSLLFYNKNKKEIINPYKKNLELKLETIPFVLLFDKNTELKGKNAVKLSMVTSHFDLDKNNTRDTVQPSAISSPSSPGPRALALPVQKKNLVDPPVLSHYLKELSNYNMRNKGIIIFYYILIGFHFNTDLNKFYTSGKKNIYKLLSTSFKSMYCLISKPVFICTPDKIIVQLFYYLFIPNVLKLKKFFNYNPNKKNTQLQTLGTENNNYFNREAIVKNKKRLFPFPIPIPNRKKSLKKILALSKLRLKQKNRIFLKNKIRKQYNKFRKIKINVRVKLRKLSNMSLVKVFPNKFKFLSLILNNIFKKPVVFDLVRIHYPYNDSNILVNLLGIMINKIKLRIIIRRFFEKAIIKNINNLKKKRGVIIPSFLSGLTIRVAGRLLTHKVVPRKTVKTTSRGASASGRINFKDIATYTNKNKRGAYSITVKAGQNLF